MFPRMTIGRASAAIVALIAIALAAYGAWRLSLTSKPELGGVAHADTASREPANTSAAEKDSVELSDQQLASVKVVPLEEREFPVEKEAIGSIDFDEDVAVQVFTPYQGRIIALFASLGDNVKKGQTLFTIDSPDLLQAESTLIAAAGVLELTTRNLARLIELHKTLAVSQRDLDQGTSDQQTAEGNLRAGRDAVRIFGKTDADIDRIIANRVADPTLVVPSPITGRITARNAAPGLFVQPGNAPAPFTVADTDIMWMLAQVPEADSPAFRVGQPLQVTLNAFPARVFDGKIITIGPSVDPNTRRVFLRSEIKDPEHVLRSGMFANFMIRIGPPVRSPGIPSDGVVREGDGTMTIWVTADRRRFTRRAVKIGGLYEGYRQILEGAHAGELVATEGALFLSNALATASASD
ncbi:MAG: efflux RND transporter periplasmic adaptor subunit [Xanthobacteraceae bacterium]